MKRDTMSTDAGPLSGKRNGQAPMSANEDLNVAEVYEQVAGMIQHSGDARVAAEAGRFKSGLMPQYVVDKSISGRTQLEAAAKQHPQSGRVSRYSAAGSVCREDPW
jgi:hypothetical protein